MRKYETANYQRALGMTLKDSKEKHLGCITAIVKEGSYYFFVVNDDFEVNAMGSQEVINLSIGESFIRLAKGV